MENKEITLQSGAILKITVAPFEESKALYQAVCEELRGVRIDSSSEATHLVKDLLCTGLSSKKIESCLAKCLARSTYNGIRIVKESDVFEKVEARADYIEVIYAVAEFNLAPFTKSLFARFSAMLELVGSSPA